VQLAGISALAMLVVAMAMLDLLPTIEGISEVVEGGEAGGAGQIAMGVELGRTTIATASSGCDVFQKTFNTVHICNCCSMVTSMRCLRPCLCATFTVCMLVGRRALVFVDATNFQLVIGNDLAASSDCHDVPSSSDGMQCASVGNMNGVSDTHQCGGLQPTVRHIANRRARLSSRSRSRSRERKRERGRERGRQRSPVSTAYPRERDCTRLSTSPSRGRLYGFDKDCDRDRDRDRGRDRSSGRRHSTNRRRSESPRRRRISARSCSTSKDCGRDKHLNDAVEEDNDEEFVPASVPSLSIGSRHSWPHAGSLSASPHQALHSSVQKLEDGEVASSPCSDSNGDQDVGGKGAEEMTTVWAERCASIFTAIPPPPGAPGDRDRGATVDEVRTDLEEYDKSIMARNADMYASAQKQLIAFQMKVRQALLGLVSRAMFKLGSAERDAVYADAWFECLDGVDLLAFVWSGQLLVASFGDADMLHDWVLTAAPGSTLPGVLGVNVRRRGDDAGQADIECGNGC
jgi:hypothetical protein